MKKAKNKKGNQETFHLKMNNNKIAKKETVISNYAASQSQ